MHFVIDFLGKMWSFLTEKKRLLLFYSLWKFDHKIDKKYSLISLLYMFVADDYIDSNSISSNFSY